MGKSRAAVIFINQLREKVGVFFGNPETTPGGRALKFYSSVRVELKKTESLKEGNQLVGARVRARVVKNKVAPPFREATFVIRFGQGIDLIEEAIDLALNLGLLTRTGSWYSYEDQRIGQGRNAVYQWLKENQQVFNRLLEQIRAQCSP